MKRKESELAVITAAKDLCGYIMKISPKIPKAYRASFAARLQNMSLEIIENLLKANAMLPEKAKYRIKYQRKASLSMQILGYFAMLARENGAILPPQHENISKLVAEAQKLLGGWINSTKKKI